MQAQNKGFASWRTCQVSSHRDGNGSCVTGRSGLQCCYHNFLNSGIFIEDEQHKPLPQLSMATTTARVARSAVAAAAPLPAIRGLKAMWAPMALRQQPVQQRRAAATLVVRAAAETEAAGEALLQPLCWAACGACVRAAGCVRAALHRHWLHCHWLPQGCILAALRPSPPLLLHPPAHPCALHTAQPTVTAATVASSLTPDPMTNGPVLCCSPCRRRRP